MGGRIDFKSTMEPKHFPPALSVPFGFKHEQPFSGAFKESKKLGSSSSRPPPPVLSVVTGSTIAASSAGRDNSTCTCTTKEELQVYSDAFVDWQDEEMYRQMFEHTAHPKTNKSSSRHGRPK